MRFPLRRRSLEEIQGEIERSKVRTERYGAGAQAYSGIQKRLVSRRGGPGSSFQFEEVGGGKPRTIWAKFTHEMGEAGSREEAQEVLNKYVRILLNRGGWTQESAARALFSKLRRSQEDEEEGEF